MLKPPEVAPRGPEGISTCCQATLASLPLFLGLTVPGILSLRKRMSQGHSGQIPKNIPAIWQVDTIDHGLFSIPSVHKAKLHVSLSHSPSL